MFADSILINRPFVVTAVGVRLCRPSEARPVVTVRDFSSSAGCYAGRTDEIGQERAFLSSSFWLPALRVHGRRPICWYGLAC